MLEVFIGGYLFHPAALDYSGDTCKNGCVYCFANINKHARESNLTGAIKSLYKKEPLTYKDKLIKHGYPICVSNRSDPFTPQNIREVIALFTHLAAKENGIFIQTKGNECIDEVIEVLGNKKNIVWYITITTIKDSIAKVIEPRAPLPSIRLELAKKLKKAGYFVIIAINPCNEAWMPVEDLDTLLSELNKIGINHICLEMLDIKHRRLSLLDKDRVEKMGEAIKTLGSANQIYVRQCTEYLIKNGFSVAKKGMPFRTTFFDDVKNILGVTMPVLQDFINYCIDKYNGIDTIIKYDEFESFIAKEKIFLETIRQNDIRSYLLRAGFPSWKDNQQIHSHKELLRIIWNDPRHKLSIQKHSLFSVIGENKKPLLDVKGNCSLFFNGVPNLNKKKEVIEL
jgi:DNA repair photolyase